MNSFKMNTLPNSGKYILIISIFLSLNSFGQLGPGGIGDTDGTTDLVLWLDANKLTEASGVDIATWSDQSGDGNNATTPGNSPSVSATTLNGYKQVQFTTGNSEYFSVADDAELNPSEISIYIVGNLTTSNPAWSTMLMKSDDDWWSDGYAIYENNNTGFLRMFTSKGGDPATGNRATTTTSFGNDTNYIYHLTHTTGSNNPALFTNGTSSATGTDATAMVASSEPLYIGCGNNNGSAGYYMDGDLAEVIILKDNASDEENIIIQNYLAAKYGLALSDNDVYDEDDNGFDHDVAGIASDNTTSQGTGIVEISGVTGLTSDEFFMWGHDNAVTTSTETTDIPCGIASRMVRIWGVSEVESDETVCDVGSIDLQFDLSGLTYSTSTIRLLIDSDGDGDFDDNDVTPISGATNPSGDLFLFSGVSDLTDGDRFTIAISNGGPTCSVINNSEPSCATAGDGQATVTVNGDDPNFSVSWSNSGSASGLTDGGTNQQTNLDAGTYTVTVTDNGALTCSCQVTMTAANCPEDYNDWLQSTPINFNTTASGANVGGNITNFPVLLRITECTQPSADFWDNSGDDIRFALTSNIATQLSYEIDRFDAGSKLAEIWVLAPQVTGNTDDDYMTMYYDNDAAADNSDANSVFATSNNFQGVWHLGEAVNNNANGYADATSNANHGTGNSMAITEVTGAIGKAQDFDGTSDYINVSDHSSLDITASLSLSFWFYLDGNSNDNNWPRPLSKGNSTTNGAYSIWVRHATSPTAFSPRIYDGSTVNLTCNVGNFDDSEWHHVYGTYTGDSLIGYIDGVYVATNVVSTTINSTADDVNIGSADAIRHWNGKIDEARISSVARSRQWIKLSYQNQKSDQIFITIPCNPCYAIGNDSWDVATTWSPCSGGDASNNIPGVTDTVFIGESGTSYAVTTSSDVNVAKLNIGTNGTFTLSNSLTIPGDLRNSGTFTHGSQTVTLDGTALQTLSGSAGITFDDLVLSNTISGDNDAIVLDTNITI
ncbi:MAG: DUF2341 domain-containing protein, partial [Flavobacteriales bacterium]|nr:DUF2341 domain-containing protein [Flavobacteriales bacterium]